MQSLGNITEFASTRGESDISERFYLQSVAREILPSEHRIKICYRHRLPDTPTVDVYHSPTERRGRVAGVMKCANSWVCPVCAVNIALRRREELSRAVMNAGEKYTAFLVTYTVQHNRDHTLRESIDALRDAYRAFRSGRQWQTLKDEYSIVGSVRATEVTYSQANGFHPHFHELLFCAGDDVKRWGYQHTADSLENQFTSEWIRQLNKRNRSAGAGVALTVRYGSKYIIDYIAKFDRLPKTKGIEKLSWEIAGAVTKSAYGEHYTMFDLLHIAGAGETWAIAAFREYAETMKGRSVLQWSRGTKALLGVETVKDEIAAEGYAEDEFLLAQISAEDWRLIRAHSAQAAIVEAAHRGSYTAIENTIKALKTRAGVSGDVVRHFCTACLTHYERHVSPAGEVVHVCPGCGDEISI